MSKLKANTFKKYFVAYLYPTLWAAVIFLFSAQESLPGFSVSLYEFIFKKSAHMFVFAVLYLLLVRAYQQTSDQSNENNKKSYLYIMVICLLYALIDELHQSVVPGRHATFRDIGYDTLGISTALLYQLKLI